MSGVVDSIAERPQHELAIHLSRDEITPLPTELSLEETERRVEKKRIRTSLWHKIQRMGGGSPKSDTTGLVVRDETFWKWYVEDNYRFFGKPKHLTWEQFAKELGSYSFYWELHPTKPEDYYILHLLKHEDPLDKQSKREVVWSAMHAAWEGPVLMDLYAALGTMMKGKLKTRTLSFDDGRGTIKEFNIQHVSPWTTAVQINARPPYHYDRDLRDIREENSTWYFSKDLITNPGINEDGTVTFFVAAEVLSYHLTTSVRQLLHRPMRHFYRNGVQKRVNHFREFRSHKDRMVSTTRSWLAFDSANSCQFPALDQLDAVTDNWLEESPFPLRDVHDKIRLLARLHPENLQYLSWLQSNKELTRDTSYHIVADYAPKLLAEGGSPFVQSLLLPPKTTTRKRIHRLLTENQLNDLKLLRESDEAREEAAETAKAKKAIHAATEEDGEEQGKERLKTRIVEDPISDRADSEQWTWIHELPEGTSSAGTVKLSS